MHAAAAREMGELPPLFMLPATKSYAHLPLTALGLYVLLYEHNTCTGDGGQSTCLLDGNGSFSLVCFLMMKL